VAVMTLLMLTALLQTQKNLVTLMTRFFIA